MGDQSVAWAVVIRKNRAVGESGGVMTYVEHDSTGGVRRDPGGC